jgi:hypothetical protein
MISHNRPNYKDSYIMPSPGPKLLQRLQASYIVTDGGRKKSVVTLLHKKVGEGHIDIDLLLPQPTQNLYF